MQMRLSFAVHVELFSVGHHLGRDGVVAQSTTRVVGFVGLVAIVVPIVWLIG